MTTTPDPVATTWRLDKRIPIALLIGLGAQSLALVVFLAQLDFRVGAVERSIEAQANYESRLVILEERTRQNSIVLERIDVRLERMEDRSR